MNKNRIQYTPVIPVKKGGCGCGSKIYSSGSPSRKFTNPKRPTKNN